MSDAKEVELSLKVFINKEKTKVLFAEADNDFADVLLSFLTLPLGKIVKILEKHYGVKAPILGSLTSLYNGLANPDMVNLWKLDGKEVLDNPKTYFTQNRNLKVSVDYTEPATYAFGDLYEGVYTKNSACFIISDDLRMVPNAMGSIMQTFSELGFDITDMQGSEMRNVTFGLKEIIHLLKESLVSPTPLSDLIFNKRDTKFTAVNSEEEIELHQIKKETSYSNSEKMILKVMFQLSTMKLLFAQAEEDFVDFLFSLLIVPLGTVEKLLGCNTGLNSIDNLYRSIADHVIHDKYLKDIRKRENLTMPGVLNYYSSYCFLPLSEGAPGFKGRRLFVEGSRTYMVTDDLTVTRLCVSSTLSVLNDMKISLSDVHEVEFEVGLDEALNIMKASLTSTCALTDGLVNPKLKRLPNPEEYECLIY